MKTCSSCSSLTTRDNCPSCTGWPRHEAWEPAHPLPLPVGVDVPQAVHHNGGYIYLVPISVAAAFARGLR